MSIYDSLSLVARNTSHQQEVCQSLGIEEEILALPQGYQTIIEEADGTVESLQNDPYYLDLKNSKSIELERKRK